MFTAPCNIFEGRIITSNVFQMLRRSYMMLLAVEPFNAVAKFRQIKNSITTSVFIFCISLHLRATPEKNIPDVVNGCYTINPLQNECNYSGDAGRCHAGTTHRYQLVGSCLQTRRT